MAVMLRQLLPTRPVGMLDRHVGMLREPQRLEPLPLHHPRQLRRSDRVIGRKHHYPELHGKSFVSSAICLQI
jgi:hypothetical protein